MTASTVLNYTRPLRDLMEYHHAEADAISADEILTFLAEREKTIGKSTLNTLCCALKYFYGKVLGDPDRIVDIPTPRKPKQIGELLTATEVRHLLARAKNLRHRLVLELLFGLGLRSSEFGRIRLGDFNKEHRTITIRNGKGGKTRVLPYGDHLRQTLIAYFRDYRPVDYLIPAGYRSEKAGIAIRGVQYIVACTRDRALIGKKFSPHTLRHSFAVHYLNNGGSLLRLQQLLGHKYLTTTLLYLSYASIPLREVASPLDFLYVSDQG
jgi:site-specific recombinase XerD